MELPKALLEYIIEKRTVLFLGSGASYNAKHKDGKSLPLGGDLADLIAEKFLGEKFKGNSLAWVAELAISQSSLFDVQQYIYSIFIDFEPDSFHKVIPTIPWKAIATTNYDLIIERAYDTVHDKIQQPVIITKNGEKIEDKLRDIRNFPVYKLHGCITAINDASLPLILTTDQYILHRKNRSRLFERIKELAYEYPFLFIGYSLQDSNIRAILLEIDAELGPDKQRSYFVSPTISDEESTLWANKKITCIRSTCKDFLEILDHELPKQSRKLSVLREDIEHPAYHRIFKSGDGFISNFVRVFISRDSEYIHKDLKSTHVDPKAFYKGYITDFSPIIDDLDARRKVTDDILSEVFLVDEDEIVEKQQLVLIKGHAGSGKSILLRRLAWDAATSFNKICFYLHPSANPDIEAIFEIYKASKERIYIFIDSSFRNEDLILSLIKQSKRENVLITIISAERNNLLNACSEEFKKSIHITYNLHYLNEREITSLLGLLESHKSLGYLERLDPSDRIKELSYKTGRQLLVALHEATLGKPFVEIIVDEYNNISHPIAQSLYLTISILHRLGVKPRAGLISRVHGISFTHFKEEFFKPLEYIVFAEIDSRLGDYVYQTRHPHIAEIVFERVLTSVQQRYDEYIRIIHHLDVDFNSDKDAFIGLTKAKSLMELFPDPQMIRQVFKLAKERAPEDPMLMQQEAIFEFTSQSGSLETASQLLHKAFKLAPWSNAIAHSLSILEIKKSERCNNPLERERHINNAKQVAIEMIQKHSVDEHPYHTLIKIEIDELRNLLITGDEPTIERKVKYIEELFNKSSQLFPESSFLLDAESKFLHTLNINPKALLLLQKAFSLNKRNDFIALRLSKLYESDNQLEQAAKVLQECLENNPNSRDAHFRYALILMRDEDKNFDHILYHLKRSFTDGDSRFSSQFWFARALYIKSQFDESRKLFSRLANASVDPKLKKNPVGIIMSDNSPKIFRGTISRCEHSYGFVIRDVFADMIFFHNVNTEHNTTEHHSGRRIAFSIGFNYRGPIALNIMAE